MIEKLLKITNPLSSSNHGNSPPKIDNSKNVKTTKISSLMSYVTKPPQKKRTIIAIPLKPKQKEEKSKKSEIKEDKKTLQEKNEVKKIETKSDNSDSLLDKNSDKSLDDLSIPEISIESGSSVSSICDSPITVTPKSQVSFLKEKHTEIKPIISRRKSKILLRNPIQNASPLPPPPKIHPFLPPAIPPLLHSINRRIKQSRPALATAQKAMFPKTRQNRNPKTPKSISNRSLQK